MSGLKIITNPSHPAVPDKPSSAVAPRDGPYPALAGGQAEGFRGSRVRAGVFGSDRSGHPVSFTESYSAPTPVEMNDDNRALRGRVPLQAREKIW
jgi:hypothetical protein